MRLNIPSLNFVSAIPHEAHSGRVRATGRPVVPMVPSAPARHRPVDVLADRSGWWPPVVVAAGALVGAAAGYRVGTRRDRPAVPAEAR